jgi:hypothetical protein
MPRRTWSRSGRRRCGRRREAKVGFLRIALEGLAAMAALAAVVGVWFTYDAVRLTNLSIELANTALEEDRVNRAWALIAAAKSEGTGNLGLVQAVETLASRGIDLNALRLPGAYLHGVQAPRVVLGGADLRKAVLCQCQPQRDHPQQDRPERGQSHSGQPERGSPVGCYTYPRRSG